MGKDWTGPSGGVCAQAVAAMWYGAAPGKQACSGAFAPLCLFQKLQRLVLKAVQAVDAALQLVQRAARTSDLCPQKRDCTEAVGARRLRRRTCACKSTSED